MIGNTPPLGDMLSEHRRAVQTATGRSSLTATKRKHRVVPQATRRSMCAAHPRNDMALFFDTKSANVSGVMTEEKQTPGDESTLRKQDLVSWNRESPMTYKAKAKFPYIIQR